jgi:adenylyltransferase/sulfurtransferase
VFIDDGRYARLRLIPWWNQDRLASATVLVAGAGALGNEICKSLALVGVGTLILVDFDRVELPNLSRSVLFRDRDAGRSKVAAAAERIAELNPEVRVFPLHGDVTLDLGLGWFHDADLVFGALDNREARLWVNRCARRTSTPWIDGGIQEIAGQVRVFLPVDACYECGMTEADYANLNLRYSCPGLRRADIEEGKVPTTPTVASIIAGLQVQEGLKILHGRGPADSQALMYNGSTNLFYTSRLPPRGDCLAHEVYPAPRSLPLSARDTEAAALLDAAAEDGANESDLVLELDRDLVEGLYCDHCRHEQEIMAVLSTVKETALPCPECGAERIPKTVYRLGRDSPLASSTLAELGVPPYDVVRVTSPGGEAHLLLAGDRPPSRS